MDVAEVEINLSTRVHFIVGNLYEHPVWSQYACTAIDMSENGVYPPKLNVYKKRGLLLGYPTLRHTHAALFHLIHSNQLQSVHIVILTCV